MTDDKNWGSKLRCLMLTGLPTKQFAPIMENLVSGTGARVTTRDYWMPRGFTNRKEAQIDKAKGFVSRKLQADLKRWWLAPDKGSSTTPNFDIACTCKIEGKQGLILVEAKAHYAEMGEKNKCTATDADNRKQIGIAIRLANQGLAGIESPSLKGSWKLKRDDKYQLSNRFAWSWKLAELGVPVVLVYLGFLNASDMVERGKRAFATPTDWERRVRGYSQGTIPKAAWEKQILVGESPMWALIRSMDLGFKVYSHLKNRKWPSARPTAGGWRGRKLQ